MHKQPIISIIIPVYNGECYLGEAIESVLAQNYRPLEIIVVDDGSTDDSVVVAQQFAPTVQVIMQPNLGAGAARNSGIAIAQGEFLAFLDADDLWVSDKLSCQWQVLHSNPDLAMVFGQVEQFITPNLPAHQRPALPPQTVMAGLHVGTMLIRRASFANVGPFATQWMVGEFIEWYGRAQALGLPTMILPTRVMRRRLHATNLTRRTADQRTDYLEILKRRLDHKRARLAKADAAGQ